MSKIYVAKNPTSQFLTSGSGTYVPPANVKWIRVTVKGGGGGGGSQVANGTAGNQSSFNTSIIGLGGSGGQTLGSGVTGVYGGGFSGGDSGVWGASSISRLGNANAGGVYGIFNDYGGTGGGAGAGVGGANGGGIGQSAQSNTGGGGGGCGGVGTSLGSNTGGGEGGTAIKTLLAGSYPYVVGAAVGGGAAGSGGSGGGNGAAGYIFVEEFYV